MEVIFKIRFNQRFYLNGEYQGDCVSEEECHGTYDGKLFYDDDGVSYPHESQNEETGYPGETADTKVTVLGYRVIETGPYQSL